MRRIVLCSCLLAVGLGVGYAAAEAPRPGKAGNTDQATRGTRATKATRAGSPTEPAASGADAARRAQVIATFDGGRIRVGDVEDAINANSPVLRARYLREGEVERLYEQLLRLELLSREAERRGFADDPEVWRATMQNAIQVMVREQFDDEKGPATLPAADVAKYYEDNAAEFNRPEMRRASFILLKTRDEAETVLKQAQDMDLRAFRQLAREKTIHEPTKLRGGDLRYFDKTGEALPEDGDGAPEALAKVAFRLETVGDLARKIIPMGDQGFAVLKLTGLRKAVHRSLADVEDALRKRLWRERRQAGIEKLIGELKAKYKPELHAELITQVKLEEPEPVPSAPGLPAQFPTQSPTTGEAPKGPPAEAQTTE